MIPDRDRVAAAIVDTAAREIAPHYRRLDKSAVRTKDSASDLVTHVDEAAERALKAALRDIAPTAYFVGEETAAADPASVAQIVAGACWVVDPLDGTRNFVNGVDEFGVIVAYIEGGRTRGAWIYAVPLGAMAIGAAGGGVSWRGTAITTEPQRAEMPTGLRSVGWLAPSWRERIVGNLKTKVATRPGHCSAYAYLKLLAGEVDFKLSSRVHPWDHAAGAMMLSELGGEARWLDTEEPYAPQGSADRPLLATAPGRNWRDIAARIAG